MARGHLPNIKKARVGKPVAANWYNVVVNNFKEDPHIAKLAEMQSIRAWCGGIIDFIVQRTMETTNGALFNVFRKVNWKVAGDRPYSWLIGMATSYELLQDCLRDIDHLLPPVGSDLPQLHRIQIFQLALALLDANGPTVS